MPKRARQLEEPKALEKASATGKVSNEGNDLWLDSPYASRFNVESAPKNRMPQSEMPAAVAYQMVKDMRQLDANPRLNLASFCTTWMEPEAEKLIAESLNVNFVDMEIYPSSTEIANRCVAMLADLYHSPAKPEETIGTSTVGSSEAIMLAGLAMKKRWQAKRKAEGKDYSKPNLVMGYNVQVCWEKFTRYFDVEEHFIPLTEDSYVMRPEAAIEACDENTIGICAILGSTYTGEYEDVEKLDKLVTKLNKDKGFSVGIHVDGASGGFVAPFVQPDLKWDFRLKNVVSINASGHKYGLVYPGVGWVIFRSKEYVPEEIIFHVNYLGSDQPSMTLNFSRGAAHVLAQYYQFLRLGKNGYTKIMKNLMAVAHHLRTGLEETGHFTIMSSSNALPLVACRLNTVTDKDGTPAERRYNEFDVSDKLKARGWTVPAYTMAPDIRHIKLLRVVIREDLSMSMAEELIKDFVRVVEYLDHHFSFTDDQLKALEAGKLPQELKETVLPHHPGKRPRLAVLKAEHHDSEKHPNKTRTHKHNGVC